MSVLPPASPRSTPQPSLGDAVAAVLQAKEVSRRRPIYVTSLRQYLTAFARGREATPISGITTQDIEEWFATRGEAPTTQASNLGRLSALFSYAVRRGWVMQNPCDRIERVTIERRPPKVLSVEQAAKLLRLASARIRPWVVLCMMTGLRPTEASKLHWSNINLATRRIVVDASASKVRQRRIVPIPEAAAAWLSLDAASSGPVVSSHSTMRRDRRALAEAVGLDWSQDVLRHTYASMRIAAGAPHNDVAREMGSSGRMLGNHYLEIISEADASAFWSLRPP